MTAEKLVKALDAAVQVPGLGNIWIPPIYNRIEMLAPGIKSPIGIKVSGADLAAIDRVASTIARIARGVPGVTSAAAEQLSLGRYLDVDIDRAAAARLGMNVADVQSIVASLIGGENVGETVEGRARYPINVRYPRDWRDTPQRITELPVTAPNGAGTTLGTVAEISLTQGPSMIRSENARLAGWVYIDACGQDLAATVDALRETIAREVRLPAGTSITFAGQYKYLARANARLMWISPITYCLIGLLLYFAFGRLDRALLIMTTLQFALAGGLWCLSLLGDQLGRDEREVHCARLSGDRVRRRDADLPRPAVARTPRTRPVLGA